MSSLRDSSKKSSRRDAPKASSRRDASKKSSRRDAPKASSLRDASKKSSYKKIVYISKKNDNDTCIYTP